MEMLTERDIWALKNSTLFRELETEQVLPLLEGSCTSLEEGEFLIHEGERVLRLWVVLEGTLHAARNSYDGQEFLYQQLRPSYLAAGEVVCTPRKTCPYSVYARTGCRLWSFPWSLVEEDRLPTELSARLTRNMLSFVSNQNMRKYFKIETLSEKSARARIMKFLAGQARRRNSPSFAITMDREDMANYLCLNRSVLSHELKKMEADGILRFRKNQFTLLERLP